jgi:integrase
VLETQPRSKQGKQRYGDLNEQIYKFNRRINTILTGLEDSVNHNTVKLFAQELKLAGLSPGRVWYYASRSAKIVRWFDKGDIQLKNATKENCKECFQHILDPNHKGPTKAAYARTLKRLVHFAKTGEIGERTFDSDYVDEVRWIRPSKYDSEYRPEVEAEDLLTPEELVSIFKAVPSVSRFPIRDKPMVMCMFEGAFRPGEILQMRIEGIRFESKIAWVKSTGKTGNTDAKPLVIACEPLMQWLKHHPYGSDPDAPVWWSYRTKSVVSLAYLERLVKKAAAAAGIKKNVWAYLLRHTKLTDIAKRHPHEILRKYGNWKRLDMVKIYVHLSSSDLKEVVKKDYGIFDEKEDKKSNALALKRCLQCGETNNPDDARCRECGIALDPDLAAAIMKEEGDQITKMQKQIDSLTDMMKALVSMYGKITGEKVAVEAVGTSH